jgi:hypothetical protein
MEDKGYFKKYYQQNKDKLLDYVKEEIICDCGLPITRGHLSRHQKTKKHTNQIKKLSDGIIKQNN